jgi:hypothetical protein
MTEDQNGTIPEPSFWQAAMGGGFCRSRYGDSRGSAELILSLLAAWKDSLGRKPVQSSEIESVEANRVRARWNVPAVLFRVILLRGCRQPRFEIGQYLVIQDLRSLEVDPAGLEAG